MAINIDLTPFELRICKALAKERQDTNDANRIHDDRIDKHRSSLEVHELGTKGELSGAKYLNVYPDFTTNSRHGGYDFMYRGWRIDVKSANTHRNLLVSHKKKPGAADIYLLAYIGDPIELIGWCFEHEVFKPERLIKLKGYEDAECYCIEENDLRSMASLIRLPNKDAT